MTEYIPPESQKTGFHCPHCGVYAHQRWSLNVRSLKVGSDLGYQQPGEQLENLASSHCEHCGNYAIWHESSLIFPAFSGAPLPSSDMPENVAADFNEARAVLSGSPRASAALLRLAIQKLCKHLGQPGANLNNDIGELVKSGLPVKVQRALDVVRVIGNNAVHPGEIDLRDDKETALALFSLVNMIVDQMISQPKQVEELYQKLPESARDQIERRDK